jgi:hypothetical protein
MIQSIQYSENYPSERDESTGRTPELTSTKRDRGEEQFGVTLYNNIIR